VAQVVQLVEEEVAQVVVVEEVVVITLCLWALEDKITWLRIIGDQLIKVYKDQDFKIIEPKALNPMVVDIQEEEVEIVADQAEVEVL